MAAEMTGSADAAEPTLDDVAGRVFEATIAAFDILAIHIGDRLGLYRALAEGGPATAVELAARTRIHPRYAREWLEQQAATGLLVADNGVADGDARRFRVPAAVAEAFTERDSPYSVAPMATSLVACAGVMPDLLDAYRTGGGVPWAAYGSDMVDAQGDFNRPWLLASLGSEYLPAIPDIDARLRADPPARVADVACGVGWASIAIARAYPKVHVDGFDFDRLSIERARSHAAEAGLTGRVEFHEGDAAESSDRGRFDLVVIIEAVHDLARPVEVLQRGPRDARAGWHGHRRRREDRRMRSPRRPTTPSGFSTATASCAAFPRPWRKRPRRRRER